MKCPVRTTKFLLCSEASGSLLLLPLLTKAAKSERMESVQADDVQLDCMDGRALLISRIRDDEAMPAESPCKLVRRNDRGCDP